MNKKLFTPGPLNTSASVKEEMLQDLGSRDIEFINVVKDVRNSILRLGNVSKEDGYECVIIQGSGTFGVESVFSSVIGSDDLVLNIINGNYGKRISKICDIHKINHIDLIFEENEYLDIELIEQTLMDNKGITHLSIVHCETTTGIINPIESIAEICKENNLVFIVDSMSIFGAIDINIKDLKIDYLVSSSNKCVEGVPGFSFVIANKQQLLNTKGLARTLSLDLYSQWEGLERDGQFRFTPPIQVILAFKKALEELANEGGPLARGLRYKENANIILKEMKELGFESYLSEDKSSYIINTFYYPNHPNFNFKEFYNRLNDKGYVIYPGKLSERDTFRIGNIGKLYRKDMYQLVEAIKVVLDEMEINLK
jgi:2-aminoethylphosphonate-pyruvate transaminase